MKTTRMIVVRGALTALLMAALAATVQAYNFLYDTPAGRTWSQMERQIQTQKNSLPADGGPRNSVEGQRRVSVMRDIARRYRDGIGLFRSSNPVTNIGAEEKRWYDYMAHSCGIHADGWDRNANDMQRIVDALRRQGK